MKLALKTVFADSLLPAKDPIRSITTLQKFLKYINTTLFHFRKYKVKIPSKL
uniref:Uncharacterized protein n=1 Tax=Rhizophora mucronata TaxID=61149 RepID=A0A2P2IXU2_RHIMU